MAVNFPISTARVLTELTGESRPDVAMLLVIKDAIAHRLEQIAAESKGFEAKYGMKFAAYKKRWDSENTPTDFSYESENDYLRWESLETRRARLENLQTLVPLGKVREIFKG